MWHEMWEKVTEKGPSAYLPYGMIPVIMSLVLITQWERRTSAELLLWELLVAFGGVAAVGDVKERIVPNSLVKMMLMAWVLVLVPQLFVNIDIGIRLLTFGFVGALVCGVVMLVVYFASRKGLGGGDVKFTTVAGLYLGFECVFAALLYGSIFSAVTGLILMALKKIGPRDQMPLIPFLYAGMILAILVR